MRSCIYFVFISFILGSYTSNAQCVSPFVTEYTDRSTTGILVHWFDINSNPLRWEIEHGKAGFTPTQIPSIDQITSKEYLFQDLSPNTAYEFYIRSVCPSGFSDWNGPFSFSTNLTNPASCGMSLQLNDNNCPDGNLFYMEVNHPGTKLGHDVFLEEVKLLMAHDWPPDLKISLESPSGVHIDLISNRGIGTDDFGDLSSSDCTGSLTLSQNACRSIQLTVPPLRGEYKPEDDLNLFHDGSNPNGIWTFHMCDRANGDIGQFLFAEIVFNQSDCRIPDTLYVQETDQSQAKVVWSQNNQCDSLLISYQIAGMSETIITEFVDCNENEYNIIGLSANTEYELSVRSKCDALIISSECPRIFTTKCEEISLTENFDNLARCSTICGDACPLNSIWSNVPNDGHEWIVNAGATPSIFTGPETDLSQFGNYIYIESSSSSCMNGSMAILSSDCLQIVSNDSECDMQFSYLMRGKDIDKLTLELSRDDGENWVDLFSIEGDQGSLWKTQALSLSDYQGELVRFRFIAFGAEGNLGDIALDQIDFFGSHIPNQEDIMFFEDKDGDGFGVDENFIQICSLTPPEGFARLFGDCDDANALIFPTQIEIACNDLDDNCNGLTDDENPLNYTIEFQEDESCLGAQDGHINILVTGGQGPYMFNWNNQSQEAELLNIGKGVYYCQIKDQNGCIIRTEFIEINAVEQINFGIESIQSPTCNGMTDGAINIQHSGGIEPYSYQWSEGSQSKNLSNIGIGAYQLTITDAQLCKFISDTIQITAENIIKIGIIWEKDPSCFNAENGQLMVSSLGAEAPITYLWNTGDSTSFLTGLAAGDYSVSLTDTNGCLAELNDIRLTNPEKLEIRIDVVEHLVCFDDPNGLIQISVSGGSPPYSFQWNTGDFNDDIFHLSKGFYSVTVTDSESCKTQMDSIEVQSPAPFRLNLIERNPVNCKNSNNGSITVQASGGTPPYQYFWDLPESPDSASVTGLSTGIYQLNAIDQFGCKARLAGIQVESMDLPLVVDINILNQNLCATDSIGILEAQVQDGKIPYDFNWSAGEKHIKMTRKDTLYGLIPGMYNVTVTDGEGCVGTTDYADLTFPEPINFQVFNIQMVLCNGDTTGQIEIQTSGGSGALNYLWNQGATTKNLSNIPSGNYSVLITDENNCEFISQDIIVNQPDEISILTNSTPSIGGQADGKATVIPSGGQYPYFYQWDEQSGSQVEATAVGLAPGTYYVSITDAHECMRDTFVVVDVINSTGELFDLDLLVMYPNPVSDRVIIHNKGLPFDVSQLTLLTIQNQTINTYTNPFLQSDKFEIDVNFIPSGLYFLHIVGEKGQNSLTPLVIIH